VSLGFARRVRRRAASGSSCLYRYAPLFAGYDGQKERHKTCKTCCPRRSDCCLSWVCAALWCSLSSFCKDGFSVAPPSAAPLNAHPGPSARRQAWRMAIQTSRYKSIDDPCASQRPARRICARAARRSIFADRMPTLEIPPHLQPWKAIPTANAPPPQAVRCVAPHRWSRQWTNMGPWKWSHGLGVRPLRGSHSSTEAR